MMNVVECMTFIAFIAHVSTSTLFNVKLFSHFSTSLSMHV